MSTEWVCEAQLGSGGFGIVHVWRNINTGLKVALKKCKFDKSDITLTQKHKAAWVREVDIMLRLSHPGVVKCIPTPPGLDPGTTDLPSLCMEFCEEGDLRRVVNRPENCRGLPEYQVLSILNDITSSLGYLHNRRIIHRDLKPENVVLKRNGEERMVYKLIDLGYAKELGVSSMAQSFVGTLQYVAPELFLGHDYTKSVDYWSLGLLCHEVVTGQRPFLPNMSPGQWIDYVEVKKYEDIWVEQSVDGEIEYHSNLARETLICHSLASQLEGWLRSLLNWSPETRGKDSQENVNVFTQLNTILSTRHLRVFCARSGLTLHLPVPQERQMTSTDLLDTVAKETNTDQANQWIISDEGRLVEPGQALQLQPNSDNIDPEFYQFNLSEGLSLQDYLKQSLAIPSLVTSFLQTPRRSVQDYHQKKMFIHGYHFVFDQERIFRHLLTSLKVLVTHLASRVETLARDSRGLEPRKDKVRARYELYKESLLHDLTRYREQAARKDRVTSQKMLSHWTSTDRDLTHMIDQVSKRITLVTENMGVVGDKLREVQSSSFIRGDTEDAEMKSLVTKSIQLYTVLRKERPSNRKDTTALQCAQVVVKMLKRRDILRMASFKELSRLTDICTSLRDLSLAVTMLDKDLDRAALAVNKAQIRRQTDVWYLLAAAIKYTPTDSPRNPEHESVTDLGGQRRISQGEEVSQRRVSQVEESVGRVTQAKESPSERRRPSHTTEGETGLLVDLSDSQKVQKDNQVLRSRVEKQFSENRKIMNWDSLLD